MRICEGVDFDASAIAVPADAELVVKRGAPFPKNLPPRYALTVKYDRTGRSWWIDADAFKDEIAELRVTYPNPDVESPVKTETATPTDTLFRRRFPQGIGPWKVQAAIHNRKGETCVEEVMVSRPELTTRIDRDFLGYADGDLLAPFGFLPPEGGDATFAEKRFGKGRYFLFTGRKFPSASQEGRAAYAALVRRLASEVRQTVRLGDGSEANAYICYGVYPRTIYFLNTDTVQERSFVYECDSQRMSLTLGPCEIRAIPRQPQGTLPSDMK